MHWFI